MIPMGWLGKERGGGVGTRMGGLMDFTIWMALRGSYSRWDWGVAMAITYLLDGGERGDGLENMAWVLSDGEEEERLLYG